MKRTKNLSIPRPGNKLVINDKRLKATTSHNGKVMVIRNVDTADLPDLN